MRTPIVRMISDQSGCGRPAASGRGKTSISSQFPPTSVPIQTPKKPSLTNREHSNAVSKRGLEPVNVYLPDVTNLPERDDKHTDEKNLSGRGTQTNPCKRKRSGIGGR